ncbi:unnamed protein product, partial [Trichobilharzia regenti]
MSMNAKASARFLLGSNQGRLHHGPPPGYSPICYARQPGQRLRLEPVFTFGQLDKSVFTGPLNSPTPQQYVFVPKTVLYFDLLILNSFSITRKKAKDFSKESSLSL